MMVAGFTYGRVRFKSFEERLNDPKGYEKPTGKEKAALIGLMFGGLLLIVIGLGV